MAKKRKANRQRILRYVRSRSFMPISELRRYFAIESDEGAVLEDERGKIYVGLPKEVGRTILTLAAEGKIGLEFSAEFDVRVLIGVYPRWQPQEVPIAEPEELPVDFPEIPIDELKSA